MNKLNKIDTLAPALNQEILNLDLVKEYQKIEKELACHQELQELEKQIKVLQKKIVNQKAKQDDSVYQTIEEYQELRSSFENHPLVVNSLYLKEELNELLQTINTSINGQLMK